MIRLTLKNSNEAWYVNPDHIVSIGKHMSQEGNTYVETTVYDGDCIVAESPEEVARKVLDYKLAMIQYTAKFQADANWVANKYLGKDDNYPFVDATEVKRYIEYLAGLEEPNND